MLSIMICTESNVIMADIKKPTFVRATQKIYTYSPDAIILSFNSYQQGTERLHDVDVNFKSGRVANVFDVGVRGDAMFFSGVRWLDRPSSYTSASWERILENCRILTVSRYAPKSGKTYTIITEFKSDVLDKPIKLHIKLTGTSFGSNMQFGVSKPGQESPDEWYDDLKKHGWSIEFTKKQISKKAIVTTLATGLPNDFQINQRDRPTYEITGYGVFCKMSPASILDYSNIDVYFESNAGQVAGIKEKYLFRPADKSFAISEVVGPVIVNGKVTDENGNTMTPLEWIEQWSSSPAIKAALEQLEIHKTVTTQKKQEEQEQARWKKEQEEKQAKQKEVQENTKKLEEVLKIE